jgi:hypothetical protein
MFYKYDTYLLRLRYKKETKWNKLKLKRLNL